MGQHLFIDHRECAVKLDGKALVLSVPGRPPASVPLHMLEQITVLVDLPLSTRLVHKLCNEGIGITLLNQRSRAEATYCFSLVHGNHERRLKQYRLVLDEEQSLPLAVQLVLAKLHTQRRALMRYALMRRDQAGRLRMAASRIAQLSADLSVMDRAALLGIEGSAARIHFDAYTTLFSDSLGFTGRNRRPPRDPVNAVLSLSYSMLTSECARALAAVGLDPAFGIYHRPDYGRPSLACDLIELVRTHADHFVWRLFAEQQLREHHFSRQLNSVVLNKEGRGIFFPRYQIELRDCRRLIHRLARRWTRQLEAL